MYEWNMNIQRMIDWIEDNITNTPTLSEMAKQLNYSKFYCTKQFHSLTGMSLREYIYLRRLRYCALELRDTNIKIIDIAVKYGFNSQEAFTRAFARKFGISPYVYRKTPKPLPLLPKSNVFDPCHLGLQEECKMSKKGLQKVTINIEVIPAHKFIGIHNINAKHYFHFWELQENIPGQNCQTVCGLLESIPGSINGQVGGWYHENDKQGYFYGIEVPSDYNGDIPAGMECIEIPESLYVIFYHPTYDYNEVNAVVMDEVDKNARDWNPEEHGYEWNEISNPTYQRSDPEKYGYAICKPVRYMK